MRAQAAFRAGAGDPREGAGSRASDTSREPQQPRAPASGSGRSRGCEAAFRAGAGDPREGAGTRASRYGASLNNLALLLYAQGDYAGAKPLFERALAICEKALGARASRYRQVPQQPRGPALELRAIYVGAKPLYERALAIREKALGAEHPDTAISLSNLAGLLRAQGDVVGALPLQRRDACNPGEERSGPITQRRTVCVPILRGCSWPAAIPPRHCH